MGFVTETGKGENGEEIIKKNIMHGHNTFWIVLLIVLILVLEGFYFYMMGADNANQKKDYKVVLIEVEEREEDGYQTCMTKVENQWVYVYPYTQTRRIRRHITTEFSTDPFYSVGLKDTIPAEVKIKELMKEQKICFSDNLTGSDFKAVLDNRKGVL